MELAVAILLILLEHTSQPEQRSEERYFDGPFYVIDASAGLTDK